MNTFRRSHVIRPTVTALHTGGQAAIFGDASNQGVLEQAGLSSTTGLQAVRQQIAQERFSRWPVVAPHTRRPISYLLAKDLIAHTGDENWVDLIRPLKSVHPDESIDATLSRMQEESASLYLIENSGVTLGLWQLARLAGQEANRSSLMNAASPAEILEILRKSCIDRKTRS